MSSMNETRKLGGSGGTAGQKPKNAQRAARAQAWLTKEGFSGPEAGIGHEGVDRGSFNGRWRPAGYDPDLAPWAYSGADGPAKAGHYGARLRARRAKSLLSDLQGGGSEKGLTGLGAGRFGGG